MTKNRFLALLLVLLLLTTNGFWHSAFALVKKTAKPVTANVKKPASTPAPAPAPTISAVQPISVTVPSVPEKQKESDVQLVLLRAYLKYWEQVNSMAYAAGQTETTFTCGDFSHTWNNYLLPQYEAIKTYAQKKKADYVLYRTIKDYESFQKYLSALRPQCLVGFKEPTQTKLSVLDKKLSNTYNAYLMEDFGGYSQVVTGFFAYNGLSRSECQTFALEEWKYDFKPKIIQFQSIAQDLWLEDESLFLKSYKEGMEGYYKFRCNNNLE